MHITGHHEGRDSALRTSVCSPWASENALQMVSVHPIGQIENNVSWDRCGRWMATGRRRSWSDRHHGQREKWSKCHATVSVQYILLWAAEWNKSTDGKLCGISLGGIFQTSTLSRVSAWPYLEFQDCQSVTPTKGTPPSVRHCPVKKGAVDGNNTVCCGWCQLNCTFVFAPPKN